MLLIYILTMKDKEMHNFSYSFGKVLYMFRTSRMSIVRSITTLYTRIRYVSRQPTRCTLSQIYLIKTLRVSNRSTVHHQEYLNTVYRQ